MGTIIRKVKSKKKEEIIGGKFRPMIRSRHPSHARLRTELAKLPFRSVIRLGSTTELKDAASMSGSRIELNPAEAIKNSSNKYLMKECFSAEGVFTASWYKFNGDRFQNRSIDTDGEDFDINPSDMNYPIVAKSYFGSKGKGNTLIKNQLELDDFKKNHNVDNYIFENYCNYNKEYRLHVTKDGCFYSCRKMLKQEFKEHPNSWQRHDDNCVWILEENENFDKPVNWDEIVDNCVKALKSCGLDFGACDLRVQNNIDSDGNKRERCNFIVVEINSAPSFGQVTLEKYKTELIKLLIDKKNGKG
jgi:glutathione synthase/RimK-type ligase-like ATP-grasp enzyme